ncbi:MAG TPA: chromosomal replication initiator protein DnaA [Tepidisphaeraceae bacterium]|nr:chromosomal replication initiator protein DnaA [Tepidisphaeraceae bacterium]
MTCLAEHETQLSRLADAIAQRVGQQRFSVWFNNSTRLDLKNDGLEIAVPNDFISEWIGKNFARPIQEAAHEVLGGPLAVRFHVVPHLFASRRPSSQPSAPRTKPAAAPPSPPRNRPVASGAAVPDPASIRLRHDLDSFVVGPANQMAYNAAVCVAELPGSQYNPLFIHGNCGLGKTHLLQGLVRKFAANHPTKRWICISGEEFTNDFLTAMRANKLDAFRRKMRDLDLLAIDDVHFFAGKKATQEEFLHTFNAIEAMGKQVVMASDNHPKLIDEFGESLVNRFISGMVVRIDPPNFPMRCEILNNFAIRLGILLDDSVVQWIAKRVTQNVRELAGAVNRIAAHVRHNGQQPTLELAQQWLGDLDRAMIAPVKPENILAAVCEYFGLERRELMSGRRQRTISLARSIAMYLIRKTAHLSFPEIGACLGKRNHSTVISACRRIERAVTRNEKLTWTSSIGERSEEAGELIQRLEEHCRAMV